MSDWVDLMQYISQLTAAYNLKTQGNPNAMSGDDFAVFNALSGMENLRRIQNATADTGRSEASIRALERAGHIGGPASALSRLNDIQGILNREGISLEAKTVTNGNFVSLQVRPVLPNGAESKGIKPIEWNIPISKDGHIWHNSQERNDLMQAVADKDGNLQIWGTAEVALNNIFNQLAYEGNKRVIRGATSASTFKQQAAYRRLQRILVQETNKAVNVGSATNPYNATALQDLRDMLKVNGNLHRQEVTKSGVYFGSLFTNILNDHFKGQGSFKEQEFKKDRYTHLLNKMALITSSMGVKKGWDVIKHSSEFSEILNNPELAVPALHAIGGLANWELEHGPVTDTHGFDMAYLNNVPAMFIDFAQKNSRKPQQATLTKTGFFNQNRNNAFGTKRRGMSQKAFSMYNGKQGIGIDDKSLDTTLLWTASQKELAEAVKLREQFLNKQIDQLTKEINTYNTAGKNIDALVARRDSLSKQLEQAKQQSRLSVRNGGFVIDENRAQEIAAYTPRTQNLSNELIDKEYKRIAASSLANKIGNDEKRMMALAIRRAMRTQVSDQEKYVSSRDAISYGARGANTPIGQDYIDQFLNEYKGGNFDLTKKTPFSILYGAKTPPGAAQYKKYVTTEADLRMEGTATQLSTLLPWLMLAKTNTTAAAMENSSIEEYQAMIKKANDELAKMGLGKWSGKRFTNYVKGIIETPDKVSVKNHMSIMKGVFDAALGRAEKQGVSDAAFEKGLKEFLPPALADKFNDIFEIKDGNLIRKAGSDTTFKKYAPVYTQAISRSFGGTDVYKFTGNDGKDYSDLQDLYTFMRRGGNPAISLTGMAGLAYAVLEHDQKNYGMPLSKGGAPLSFGYREFNSLDTLLGLSQQLNPSANTAKLKGYFGDLRTKTAMSRNRYQGLLDLYETTKNLTEDTATNESSIRAKKGFVFDIDEELLQKYRENPAALAQGLFDSDIQSTVSNLPKVQSMVGLPIAALIKARVDAFRKLSSVEQEELLAQAGGDKYLQEVTKNIQDTDIYKAYAKDEASTQKANDYIKSLVGSSMMPTFVRVKGADGQYHFFPNNVTGNGGAYLGLPYLNAAGIFNDKNADVWDLGSEASGDVGIFNHILSTLASEGLGAGLKTILPDIAESVHDIISDWHDEMTEKGTAIFDESQKVPMFNSFQAKVIDQADYKEVTKDYQDFVKNAIIVTPKMVDQMLAPTKDTLAGLKEGEQWSDVLFKTYGETTEKNLDTVKKDWEKYYNKNVKNQDRYAGKDLTPEQLENEKRKWATKAIKDAITLENQNKVGLRNGLMGLALRYPNILGDFDVLPTKILTSSGWKNQNESIVGMDPFLASLMNADYDGDTLTAALMLAQGDDGMDRIKGMRDVRKSTNKVLSLARAYSQLRESDQGEGGTPVKDLTTPAEIQGVETFLTKSGKSFTGLFSNIRQGFQNALHDRTQLTNITDEDDLKNFIAITTLGHMLGMYEQAGISAKKMSASELMGVTQRMDTLYEAINNPETWKTENGIKSIIALSKDAGVFAKNGKGKLGLTDDDSSAFRMAFTPFADSILLAQRISTTADSEVSGDKKTQLIRSIGSMIGLKGKSLDVFEKSLSSFQFDENGELSDEASAIAAFKAIEDAGGVFGFSERGILESYRTINKYLAGHPVESTSGKKLFNIADVIGDKRNGLTKFVAGRIYGRPGGENPLNIKSAPGQYTDAEKQMIIASGGIVVPEGYTYSPGTAMNLNQEQLYYQNQGNIEEERKLGATFFYNPERLSSNHEEEGFLFNKFTGALAFNENANTPTRIIGQHFPFIKKHADYNHDQYNTILEDLDKAFGYGNTKRSGKIKPSIAAGQRIFNNLTPDKLNWFAREFQATGIGNLAHMLSQGMMRSLSVGSNAEEVAFIKSLLTDPTTGLIANTVSIDSANKLYEKINENGLTLEGLYNAEKESENLEDRGGVRTQKEYFEYVNKLLDKNHKWKVITDENGNVIEGPEDLSLEDQKKGIASKAQALLLNEIRAGGFVNPDGTLNEAKLRAAGYMSELPIIGMLNNRGKAHGRIDFASMSYAPEVYQGFTSWRDIQNQAAINQLVDSDLLKGVQSKEELISLLGGVQTGAGEAKRKYQLAQALKESLENPTPGLELTITDLKTARKDGDPYATNVLQVLDYAIMAKQMQHTIHENAGSVSSATIDAMRKAELAYQEAAANGAPKSKIQKLQKESDDLWKKFFNEQFLGSTSSGNRDILRALTEGYQKPWDSMSDEEKAGVQQWLKKLTLFDTVSGRLNKVGPNFAATYGINIPVLMSNPIIQRAYGRMLKGLSPWDVNDNVGRYEIEGEIFKSLYKTSGITQQNEAQVSRAQFNALAEFSNYKQALSRFKELNEKGKERTVPEEGEYKELSEKLGYTGNKGNTKLGAVVSALRKVQSEGGGPEGIIDTLRQAGFTEQEAQEFGGRIADQTNDQLMLTLSQDRVFDRIMQGIIDSDTEKTQRDTGSELNKWYKSKKTQLENNQTIRALELKKLGALNSGDVEGAKAFQDQIDNLRISNAQSQEEIERVANLYKNEPDNVSWKTIQAQWANYENKHYKDQGTEDRKVYIQKTLEKGIYEQQIADIKQQLTNPNLSDKERFGLAEQLSDLKRKINEEVDNYLTYLREQVKDSGTVDKVLGKQASQELATTNATIAQLTTGEQQRAQAFGIYNDVYGAQYALDKNQLTLTKGQYSGNVQKRLLELEQIELGEKLKLANAQRDKYELEHPELATLNAAQREKAELMYQQRSAALTTNPGAIGRLETNVGGLLVRMAKGYGLHRVLARLMRSVSQLINQALALDKVLANLRIVTGDSKDSTRQLMSEYANLGKAIGVTTTEVASSAVEWLRQGYQTAEVLDLVKSSMYLSKLGMMDASTATQSLTSALKGFKLQASESTDVVDKLTAIDMKAATSAGEIAQGLAQFANLGSLAGVNIDQAAAYVATISDVTQMSGSSAGQALKTIISRYGNVKAGAYTKLNTDSESSDENVNINDVERVLSKLGISIRKSNLEFKDFDEVLDSIAEKWGTLDRVSQKAVATAFAGIRQQEAFVTLLQNWDKYQELLEVSENSKGTSEKKMVSYKESFEAAKNSFTAALQDFINRAEVNDLLTKLVKIGTKMVEILPKLLKHLTNLFFSIQAIKSFTGNSLIIKALTALGKTGLVSGLKGLYTSRPTGLRGMGKWRYYLGGGSRQIIESIFGSKPKKPGTPLGRLFGITPTGTAANATTAVTEANKYSLIGNIQATNAASKPVLTATPTASNTQVVTTAALSNSFAGPISNAKYNEIAAMRNVAVIKPGQAYAQPLANRMNLSAMSISPGRNAGSYFYNMYNPNANTNAMSVNKTVAYPSAYQLTDSQIAAIQQMKTPYGAPVDQSAPITAKDIRNYNKTIGKGGTKIKQSAAASSAAVSGAIAGISYGLNQLAAGITAYQMTGQTHKTASGKEVQSSEAARKKGGAIAAAWSGLVPFVGSFIGEAHAQKVMKRIDSVKDSVDEVAEKASNIVSSMKEIGGNVDTLTDIADSDSFDVNKMQDAIDSITSAMFGGTTEEERKKTKEAREALQANLGRSLYSVLDEYENGDEATRKKAARELKLATMQTEHQNSAKARSASIYNSTHSDVNKDNYITYRKNIAAYKNGINGGTGLSNEAYYRALTDEKYHAGSIASAAVGTSAIAGGVALLGAGELFGKAAGAFLVAAGAITDGLITPFVAAKETEAAIAEEQQKMFDDFQSKSIFEQEEILKADRELVMRADDVDGGLGAIDVLLKDISDTTSQILSNLKQTNKEKIQEAILSTALIREEDGTYRIATNAEKNADQGIFLDALNNGQMKALGEEQLIDFVARQVMEAGGLEGYYTYSNLDKGDAVSEYARKMIVQQLSAYDKKFEEFFNGGIYTLAETLAQRNKQLVEKGQIDRSITERLKNFANAFGVTVEELDELSKTQGLLKLSEVLQSTQDTITSIEEYGNLMGDITDSTKSATKWMSEIVSKYPELIAYMSDTPKLIDNIMLKVRELIESQFTSQFSELMQQSSFYESLKTLGYEEAGFTTLKSGIDAITDPDLSKKLWEMVDGASDLQKLWENLGAMDQGSEEVTVLKDIIKQIGDEYYLTSDAYNEFLQEYAEGQSKELEKQLANLESQKQALQDINKQREYQNQLIEAQLKLENAMNEKQRVYRAGVGFVYEADQTAIAKAQEELNNLENNKEISELEQQTQLLQTIKDQWDNLYAEKSYELQKKQNEALEEYLIGDGGFENDMTKLATVSVATEGSTRKLSDMIAQQFGTQDEKREAAINEAADLLLAYEESENDQDLLQRYQNAVSEVKNLGGSVDQIQKEAATQVKKNPGAYKKVSLNAEGQLIGGNEGVDDAGNKNPIRAESVGSQPINPDKFDVATYKVGETWLRGLYSDETSGYDILSYVYGDSLRTSAVGHKTNALSAGDWVGFYGDGAFQVYVPSGNGFEAKTLTQYQTGRNDLGTGGTDAFNAYSGLSQGEFYKQIQSAMSSSYVILGGLLGDDEYVYVPKSGDPIPLKTTGNMGSLYGNGWKQGSIVSIGKSDRNKYQYGTLSTIASNATINEVGTEAIITPNGTITALPSHTGIVPADITRNLWSLGELAPALIRVLSPKLVGDRIGSIAGDAVTDESFNISTLNMNVTADGSFDADAFVDSIKTRANLTKNIRR